MRSEIGRTIHIFDLARVAHNRDDAGTVPIRGEIGGASHHASNVGVKIKHVFNRREVDKTARADGANGI
jgi:hypothetical protein